LFSQTKDKFASLLECEPKAEELGNVLGHCTFIHSAVLDADTVDEATAANAGLSLQNMMAAIRAGYCNAW
jgi:hypothetical protein